MQEKLIVLNISIRKLWKSTENKDEFFEIIVSSKSYTPSSSFPSLGIKIYCHKSNSNCLLDPIR